jgi:long-subunit fatty acid transport protein
MRRLIGVVVLCLTGGVAHAGGLFVADQGAQGLARAGAFVVKASDPTAIYYNPSGMLNGPRGYQLYLSTNLLFYNQTFDRSGNYPSFSNEDPAYEGHEFPRVDNEALPQPIPFLAAVLRERDFALGAGFFAPHAFPGRDFASSIATAEGAKGAPSPVRYDILQQQAIIILPSLAASYRVHELIDIGVRAGWGMAFIKATQDTWALEHNLTENPGSDARFTIDVADHFAPQGTVGVTVRPFSWLELAATYTSSLEVRAKGTGKVVLGETALRAGDIEPNDIDVKCATGGVPGSLKACLNLNLPQMVATGARFIFRDAEGVEKADVELDVRWENWSAERVSDYQVFVDAESTFGPVQETLIRHGLQDVWAVRLGGSYMLPIGRRSLELHGGVSYDSAAAADSWTREDLDAKSRVVVGTGVSYQLSKWRFEVSGAYVHEPDITVTQVDLENPNDPRKRAQPDPASPTIPPNDENQDHHPINNGTHKTRYIIGSLGVVYEF